MVGQQSLMYQKLDRIACTATQLASLKYKIGLFSDVVFQGQGLILLANESSKFQPQSIVVGPLTTIKG